jgi:hypothetical protein
MQHYAIKFVSDLQQVGGFLPALRFPPPIKLTASIELDENKLLFDEMMTPFLYYTKMLRWVFIGPAH